MVAGDRGDGGHSFVAFSPDEERLYGQAGLPGGLTCDDDAERGSQISGTIGSSGSNSTNAEPRRCVVARRFVVTRVVVQALSDAAVEGCGLGARSDGRFGRC